MDVAVWEAFNTAMAGATAALAGLVIVAASVNIKDIITAVSLTSRLAASIAALVLALIASAVGLIPGLTAAWYAASVVFVTLVAGVFQVNATVRIYQNRHPENRLRFAKAGIGFVPLIAYLVGGVMLLVNADDPAALALFAVGSIVSIVAALLVSWIVLVEVLR
jgi:hypothetical protein